jgi:hypothetical protein
MAENEQTTQLRAQITGALQRVHAATDAIVALDAGALSKASERGDRDGVRAAIAEHRPVLDEFSEAHAEFDRLLAQLPWSIALDSLAADVES